jgi:hypothetical protein
MATLRALRGSASAQSILLMSECLTRLNDFLLFNGIDLRVAESEFVNRFHIAAATISLVNHLF